ncbi:PAS domain-containing protein [Tolypothrix sp. PCC 7910]|uniref:PAS domain-containing protein n=1 Tax=Tolypothrix sp. PCC 7910 TaxID=2099387 RepID=UPI0014276FE2|nr:PAS domain-containing protein [Tolypothrix sp. PCC 7910]QIR40312.1 PAS domain-containing protein [Tolypothrix sp. PCC 7910]
MLEQEDVIVAGIAAVVQATLSGCDRHSYHLLKTDLALFLSMVEPYQILLVINGISESASYTSQFPLDEIFSYKVLTEPQHTEILAVCQSQQIDGIILECVAPDLGPLNLLNQLQQHLGKNCPPIVVIGSNDAELAVQALKHGAVDYLIGERITPERLRLTMDNAIANYQSQCQLEFTQEQFQSNLQQQQNQFQQIINTAPIDINIGSDTVRQILAYATSLRGEQNKSLDAVEAFLDVTESSQATTVSQQRYRELAEAMPQMVWTADATGAVNYWNQRWYEYSGLTEAQSMGLACASTIHPDERDRTLQLWSQSVIHGHPFEMEYRLRRWDGVYHWFISRGIPTRDEQGKITGWIGTITDIDEHKRLEERFCLVLKAINGLVFDWNLETNAVYRSEKLFAIIGVHPEDAPPTVDWWLDRTHPDDIARLKPQLPKLYASPQELYETEYRVRHEDGHWVDVWEQGCLVRDQQGQVIRVIGSTVDISDRKQAELQRRKAEEKLQKSEAEFRTISNAAPAFVWVCDREGNNIFFNKRWYEYTGQTAAQAQGYGWAEMLHPEDMARILPYRRQCQQTGETYEGEVRYRRHDGEYRWHAFRALPRRDTNGEIEAWYGVSIDISDSKQAEQEREQLLANERHYAQQLQGLAIASLAINSALSVPDVLQVITNQAAWIVGAHQSVISMAIDQNWSQAINAIFLSDKYAAWRDYAVTPDGTGIYNCVCHSNRPMRMTQAELEAHPQWKAFGKEADKHPPMRGWLAVPLVGRQGQNMGLIQLSDKYEGEFTEADESILVQLAQMASVAVENARLYEAEQQAREAAECANRIKDEFLAVLSHELRSPLNPILGWSRLLQIRKFDDAKTAVALATIERNAKLQTQLIDDLLDVAKILRGKLSLNIQPVNLAFVIAAAIDTVKAAAVAKSISLHPVLPNIGQVSGDAARLQQIIWNLLTNAIKFSPSGGRVDICLQQVAGLAEITVKDTGKGINPDFIPHIFESFRQEDASTTRQFGGLGLGLAIVKQLVEAHGGTIIADSPGEGLGATFTVQLPLLNVEPEPQPVETSLAQIPDLTGIRVLIVDDEPDAREMLAVMLTQYGAEAMTAKSATTALATLETFNPNLLVSDIGMPEVDGYSLMQQIRALPPERGGEITAIALTAYAGEMDSQQAIAAGFQLHLPKPVEPEVLVKAIIDLWSLGTSRT